MFHTLLIGLNYSITYSLNIFSADKDLLEKQKKVLSLFRHINQHCHNQEHEEIIKTFNLEDNKDQYSVSLLNQI